MIKQKINIFILSSLLFFLFSFSINKNETKKSLKIIKSEIITDTINRIKITNLNAKKFIELCAKSYNKNKKLNFVVFSGDFPKNWVKKKDVEYLISKINSEQKCSGYMNIFSSYISSDNAEVGGFAILFLKSYIDKKQINLGLNSNPKVDKKEIEIIQNWYKSYRKLNL